MNDNSKYWAMACHIAGVFGLLPPWNIVLPLGVWLLGRENDLVNEHGKSAMNFQLTLLIPMFILLIIYLVSALIWKLAAESVLAVPLVIVIWPLMALGPCLYLLEIVLVILACRKANRNEPFRYPLSFRIIK